MAPLRGCALALVTVIITWARPAHAEKTYPVFIESTPTGATVYLDSKDSEPLGQTPYKGQLEAGSYMLIVELDRYDQHVQDVTIKKSKAVQKFKVPLKKSPEGELKVVAAKGRGDVKNAVVYIDGKEWGTLPDRIKVPAGPHQVEVKKEGFKTYEAWIEVGQGEVKTVKAELVTDGSGGGATAAEPAGGGDGGGNDAGEEEEEEEDGGDGGGDEVATGGGGEEEAEEETDADIEDGDEPAERPRAVPFFAVGAGFELGARQFRYKNPTIGNLRPYDAGGVPLVRASLELTPLAFIPSVLASGWTLTASYARATPLDSTAELMGADVTVPTKWTELDLGVGFRYRFGASSWVGPQVGYGVHSFNFDFTADSDPLRGTIPDVKYKFVWLGLDSRIGFGGRFSGLATAGTRLVRETGDIGSRFQKTDVVAFALNAGVAATITKAIEARLVGRFDQYSHSFTPKTPPEIEADGGTDRFFGVTLSAAFLY